EQRLKGVEKTAEGRYCITDGALNTETMRRSHMDKINKFNHRLKRRPSRQTSVVRPSRAEAERAVRTLIRWAGDDPDREGLIGTPARVARAYEEWYAGYFE